MQPVTMEKPERWFGFWQVGTEKAIMVEAMQCKRGHGFHVEIWNGEWLENPGSCPMKKMSCPTSHLKIPVMSSLLH